MRIHKNILQEAKNDIQALIDFAGEDLANRFLAVKHKFEAPRNDLYFWIKQGNVEKLRHYIEYVENQKSGTQLRKEAKAGAELVSKSEHWKVYHITTFAASQFYGRFTKWCITGVNNYGDRYWKSYTERDGVKFYFVIKNGTINPEGREDKFAIAQIDEVRCEIYDQKDDRVGLREIPFYEEIDIPGLDLDEIDDAAEHCENCGAPLYEDEAYFGPEPYWEPYCEDCFNQMCAICANCNQTVYASDSYEANDNREYCDHCYAELFAECYECGEEVEIDRAYYDDYYGYFCSDCQADAFIECDDCGELIYSDDEEAIHFVDGANYCEYCFERMETISKYNK